MRFPTRAPITALALLTALSTTLPASAQFSQYTEPGGVLERGTSRKEQMEKAVENARWRLGPVRLSPWFTIRDAAYVSDVFAGSRETAPGQEEEDSDFTITAGAGLQGFLPIGPKSYFTFDALPHYVYWQELEERRRLNGYYGASLLGFFNRLTLEATARRAEEQGVLTPEFEQRVHSRQDRIEGLIEVKLTPSLFLFTSGSSLETSALTEDLGDDPRLPPFQELDREERVLRGGLEARFRERLRVAVGVERSEVDFLEPGHDRSNSGTSPLLEWDYQSDRLKVSGGVAFRSLEPEGGSEFVPFDDATGQLQVTLTPRWRLSYSAYATRNLVYSLEEDVSHFTSDRFGLSISAKVGQESSVTLFGETGGHDYETASAALARDDDFTAFGTQISLSLRERVRFNFGVSRSEIDSSLPGLDRSLTVVQSSIEISAFGGALTVR